MGILNMSHGLFYMLGAYIGWTIAVSLGMNFLLAIIAGSLAAGVLGLIIERGFLNRLYRKENSQVLVTMGFVYIITNLCQMIWGSIVKPPYTAPLLSGSVQIVGWPYPIGRIVIIAVGLLVAAILWWIQAKTRAGAIVRAGMDNKEMTEAMGINIKWTSSLVFFGGSCVAGFAGVMGAQLLGAATSLGSSVFLLSLIVVVVGGMGSIQGALVGAIAIGLIDAFGKVLFPVIASFTMYIFMVIILIIRPTGILGRKI
jgi:branched-chain amino acid transport system permease protein